MDIPHNTYIHTCTYVLLNVKTILMLTFFLLMVCLDCFSPYSVTISTNSLICVFVHPLDKDKERSKDKKKSDKHRSSSSSKLKEEPNHDNDLYGITEPEGAVKSEPMEEGECYDQDLPMHQEY